MARLGVVAAHGPGSGEAAGHAISGYAAAGGETAASDYSTVAGVG